MPALLHSLGQATLRAQPRCVEKASISSVGWRLAHKMACGARVTLNLLEPNDRVTTIWRDGRGPAAPPHLGAHASPGA
eukprot:675286-Pyramimonas_sp.AAC.1